MKTQLTATLIAPLFILSGLPATSTEASSLNSKCLLEIDGEKHMDDRCHFRSDTDRDSDYFSDLRLLVTCPNGIEVSKTSCYGYQEKVARAGVFGFLFREKDTAAICWNAGTRRKASSCFEGLRRSGACWSNLKATTRYNPSKAVSVKFCAWAE